MDISGRWEEFKSGMRPRIAEWRFMLRRLRKSNLAMAGIIILVFFIVLAIIAPILAPPTTSDPFQIPQDTDMQRVDTHPTPPTTRHIFGTTENQYDLWYGCIWGSITAFRTGVLVVAVSLLMGLLVGVLAGFYGGILDEILMRFTDIIIAFPGLILAMALRIAFPTTLGLDISMIIVIVSLLATLVMVLFHPDRRLTLISLLIMVAGLFSVFYYPIVMNITLGNLDKVLIAITLVGWPGYARVIRGEVLRIKNEDYIEASRASGSSDLRTIYKHILPNGIYPLLIVATLDIGSIVLTAAAMSFLGLGAPDSFADWGQIISKSRDWITDASAISRNFHAFFIPGLFITTFVVGWNLLGDALRDVLDPMLRRR